MLDVTKSLQSQSSPATAAEVNASPYTAFQFDSSSTHTEIAGEITTAIRRLRVALEARFIALVLSDDSRTRARLLTQLTQSLPAREYRILSVQVPPLATRRRLTGLIACSAGLVEPEEDRTTCSPLAAYDLWRRFEVDVVRSYATGQRTLVIFNDAELLSPAGLHLIHSLSNITAGYDLAVSLILAAETSFAVRLRRPAWRALASRTGAIVRVDTKRQT